MCALLVVISHAEDGIRVTNSCLEFRRVLFRSLKELKRKVIYIDFWASWCASCKAEMEPSAKLRHEFKDKDIAFVYLAYNDKKDNWRASLEKQKLSNQPYSFFILNSKNSKLLQELKVNLIPRFIIIDKQGNIVNAHAPRPGRTAIVYILKQYL